MDSVLLGAPQGITARMGWDPSLSVHDRIRILARELLADALGVDGKKVHLDREAPFEFGHHTQLIPTIDDVEVPLLIRTASFRTASVVAIAPPTLRVGLDIRDLHPDEDTLYEMRKHSHLWDTTTEAGIINHWTRVQAVLQADARGNRIHPENVRLDTPLDKGWVPDRKEYYRIVNLSRGGFVITLAYGEEPA